MNEFSHQEEKAQQKMFEVIFEYAGAYHVDNTAKEMEESEELEESICFPLELDAKIRKLILKYGIRQSLRQFWKTSGKLFSKAAVFFFVCFTIFSAVITGVEAFRVRVLDIMAYIRREYTSFGLQEKNLDDFQEDTSEMSLEWENVNFPSYIPVGFHMSKMQSLVSAKYVEYSNDKGQLIVFQQYDGEITNLRVDTETSIMEDIMIDGVEVLMIKGDNDITLIWYIDDITYYLTSDLDKNELIKMAKSVKNER